jgi:hypothetical protein
MSLTCCVYERPTNNPRLKRRWSSKYMPTVQTVTVKSSAGDYSSLSAAEAGEQADLVSGDVQLDIECYAFQDTSAVTFDGWTTDATRYIRVYTPTAERHDGKWDTSAYRLEGAANFAPLLIANEAHTRFEGLQVRNTITGDGTGVELAANGCRFTEGVVRSPATSGGSGVRNGGASGDTVTFRNCVIVGSGAVTGAFSGYEQDMVVDNCTIAAFATGVSTNTPLVANTVRNTYVDATTPYVGTHTRTTCAHSAAGAFAGSTASVAYGTSNFVSVTGGSEDLHLVTGSALIGAGTDLSGTFTTDIDGDTRSAWDIGADEFQGGGGGILLLVASDMRGGTAAMTGGMRG